MTEARARIVTIATASMILAAAMAFVSLRYRGATDFNFLLRHYAVTDVEAVDGTGKLHSVAVIPDQFSNSRRFWTLVSRYREQHDVFATARQAPAPWVLNMGSSGTAPAYRSSPALEFAVRGNDVLVYSSGGNHMLANLVELMSMPDDVLANAQIYFNFWLGWALEGDRQSWFRFQDAGRPESLLHALSNPSFDAGARQELLRQCLDNARTSLKFICQLASYPILLWATDWIARMFAGFDATLTEVYDGVLPPDLLFPDVQAWKSTRSRPRVDNGPSCDALFVNDMKDYDKIPRIEALGGIKQDIYQKRIQGRESLLRNVKQTTAFESREIDYLRGFLEYLRFKKVEKIDLVVVSSNHTYLSAFGLDWQAKELDDFEATVEKEIMSEFPEVRVIPSMKTDVPGAWQDTVHGGPAQDNYIKTQMFGDTACH